MLKSELILLQVGQSPCIQSCCLVQLFNGDQIFVLFDKIVKRSVNDKLGIGSLLHPLIISDIPRAVRSDHDIGEDKIQIRGSLGSDKCRKLSHNLKRVFLPAASYIVDKDSLQSPALKILKLYSGKVSSEKL